MKTTLATILLLAATACGAKSGGAGVAPHNETARPSKIGPAPSIAWDKDAGYSGQGLPSVAFDGSRFVVDHSVAQPGGSANLSLLQIDRTDQRVDTHVVLPFLPEGSEVEMPSPQQLSDANAYLASTNQQYGWVPVAGVDAIGVGQADGEDESSPNPARSPTSQVTAGAIEIDFEASGHLVIHDGGKVVLERSMTAWLAPVTPVDPAVPCENPAFLQRAYVDAAHSTALLEISYTGTDSCWEPDSQLHVVTWP